MADTASVADSFVAESLDWSASDACAGAAGVLVAAASFAGVAASDWARAAEKSLLSPAASAAPCAVAWVAPAVDAPDAPLLWFPDLVPRLLPAGFEPDEAERAAPEPEAEDPPAGDCAVRDGEDFASAEPLPALPAADDAGEDELAELDVEDDGDAAEPRAGERPDRMSVAEGPPPESAGDPTLAAMGDRPARPGLLRALVGLLLLDLVRREPLLRLPMGCEVADRRRPAGCVAPALELRGALHAGL